MKISEKDIRFVIYTAVFALSFMALMHAIAPRLPAPPPPTPISSQALEKADKRIVPLDTLQLRQKLHAGKPTLLFIYTSWCPYCQQALPGLISMADKGHLKKTRVLYVSMDKDRRKLAEYLASGGYAEVFQPYLFNHKEKDALLDMLHSRGSHFSGSIPYAALFDADGALVAETSKNGDWGDLLDAIKEMNP